MQVKILLLFETTVDTMQLLIKNKKLLKELKMQMLYEKVMQNKK